MFLIQRGAIFICKCAGNVLSTGSMALLRTTEAKTDELLKKEHAEAQAAEQGSLLDFNVKVYIHCHGGTGRSAG